MQRFRRLFLGRVGPALALLGLVATTSVVAVGAPAHAAVRLTLRQRITVPGLIRHQIIATVPMSQADAQSQLDRGASMQIECYGADPIADDLINGCPNPIGGSAIYTGGDGLIADENGVRLDIVTFYEKGGRLNEDVPGEDDIYVTARWIDAEGHIITLRTEEIHGDF